MRRFRLPQEHRLEDRDGIAPVLSCVVQLLEVVLVLDVDEQEQGQSFWLGVHLVNKLGDDPEAPPGSPHGVLQVVVIPVVDHLGSVPGAGTFEESS